MTYTKFTEDGLITVHSLEECLQSIRIRDIRKSERIDHLLEENIKLKDAAYKDSELARMKEEIEKMRQDYRRGFPIGETEMSSIHTWTNMHNEEAHKNNATGAIGGRYSYIFTPTGLGTIGRVRCSCGAEFTFQDIL